MRFRSALTSMSMLQKLTIVLLISNSILALGLVYALIAFDSRDERIVLVPPQLEGRAEVSLRAANAEYMKAFGLFVATLTGNIQPRAGEHIINEVSTFMIPKIYNAFREQALQIIRDPMLRQNNIVTVFLPSSVHYEAATSRVFVVGSMQTKGTGIDRRKNVVYDMGVTIQNGRPWVTSFTSYEGTTPRSVSWHANNTVPQTGSLPPEAVPINERDVKPEDLVPQ